MSGTSRSRSLRQPENTLLLIAVATAATAVIGIWLTVHLSALLTSGATPPLNPFQLTIELITARRPWPAHGTVIAGALALIIAATAAAILTRPTRRRNHFDSAATLMTTPRSAPGGRRARKDTARRFGTTSPGLPVGVTVRGNRPIHQGWEDVACVIAGARSGKTTSLVIPQLLAAPGAALATSNKRDILDATRLPRSAAGNTIIFDPQQLVGAHPEWWWNPLQTITTDSHAVELAEVFVKVSAGEGRTDAFFTPAGKQLLANYLLAASLNGGTLAEAFEWLTMPTNRQPADILARHGYHLQAADVLGEIDAPDRQRAGVFATAKTPLAFVASQQIQPWCTHPTTRSTPHLDVQTFVRSSDTLYLLSKEGSGTAAGLITALTVAVANAAQHYAEQSGGRMPTPLVMQLDEAANICPWPELPNLYSHFGGRGIIVSTYVQSWSQLVAGWGKEGARKLWGAATVRIAGSGLVDTEFLGDLAHLIGDFDRTQASTSTSRQGGSSSLSTTRERILDIADLGAMPRGRAIVLLAGQPPTLARLTPWMNSAHAPRIRESIAHHSPTPPHTTPSETNKPQLAPPIEQVTP